LQSSVKRSASYIEHSFGALENEKEEKEIKKMGDIDDVFDEDFDQGRDSNTRSSTQGNKYSSGISQEKSNSSEERLETTLELFSRCPLLIITANLT
jgi:hypothetical protein